MATTNYLAVDLGAESGRTIVGRFDGEKLQLEETHRFPNGPVRVLDTLHWPILRLWQEIKNGISASVQAAGVPRSIGVDTWGVDFGLVFHDGSLAGIPVHYRDVRTDGMMERAFQTVPKADIYNETGLQFMKFNTLFQLLAAKEKAAPPLDQVDKMLLIPDLFNFFLTGQKAAEYTIASTTQMINASSKTWATGMLQRFGIPQSILPDIVQTGSKLGKVLSSVADETGAAGVEVIATASHDTAAAVASVPAKGNDWCYISSGTWSLMGAELKAPAITEATLAANFTNEGGIDGTIRFLKNIMGLWLVQQCRRSFEKSGKTFDYATLTRLAAEAPAFASIINPDRDEFINPEDMPSAIAEFCKQTQQPVPNSEGAYIRCCLESLALKYRRTMEQISEATGTTIRTIHIVGGGSQNELLCQMTADCCQCAVVTGPIEATAMGNCLVQAIACGELASLQEAREVVSRSFDTRTYEPKDKGNWDEKYDQFLRML